MRAVVAQIKLLVTACSSVFDLRQRVRAPLTRLRKHVDDGIDAFHRKQRPVRAAMALLPAAFAT